jgi:AcrR family transcriptional regulator
VNAPRLTQQERTERSTRALLDAAADLIVEGGFESLTFAAIGERAGYSRGLVTARFGSKSALVEALIDRIVTTWSHRNVLPRTHRRSGLDSVGILLDAIRRQAERDPSGLRVLYALVFEALGSDDELRTRFAKFHETMRVDVARMIAKGQRDGTVPRGLSPEREATLVVAGLRGLGYQWLLDPDRFDIVVALGDLHDVTLDRLAATDTLARTGRIQR